LPAWAITSPVIALAMVRDPSPGSIHRPAAKLATCWMVMGSSSEFNAAPPGGGITVPQIN